MTGEDRRTILHYMKDWPGWDEFDKYIKACDNAPHPQDSKIIFVTIFETGTRKMEAVGLRPEQFKINENVIIGQNIQVLKYRKTTTRPVVIKRDDLNPLAEDFVDIIQNCSGKYLIPAYKRGPYRTPNPDFPTSGSSIFRRVTEIHEDLFPHIIRGYRASHLTYERGFEIRDIMAWFNWKNADSAAHYTRTRDIARRMGIKDEELPTKLRREDLE